MRLYINIDHVATIRQALRTDEPDPVLAAHAAVEAGAVINDHHGVGMRLAPYMKDQLGDAGMKTLRAIKRGLDPNNILCPGKLGL